MARVQETWTYDDVIRRVLEGPDPVVKKPPQGRAKCPNHPQSRARCRCGWCKACCLRECKAPGERASSRCAVCAWCVVCRQPFRFETLSVTGPDLCPTCLGR